MYHRAVLRRIQKSLFQGKTILLYGARQVGKTTLVKNILQNARCTAKYIDCDLIENRKVLQSESLETLQKFLGNYKLVVIDEAQRVKNIGLNLKILHDNCPDMQVIATGSSSFELAQNVNEPLTGRSIEFFLPPLSFEEISEQYDLLQTETKRDHMLRFGLYPDIFDRTEQEATTMLKSLSSNYLYKDILELENLKKPDQLIDILQMLSLQIGSEVSYSEIGQKLGMATITVQKYIALLEHAFVIFRLRGFSRNLRNEIHKSVKIYFWDIGIRNSVINNWNPLHLRSDVGALWENFCIAERRKYLLNHQQFVNSYFWRTYTQKKIDYLEESDGQLRAFEIKWNAGKKARIPKQFLSAYPESTFSVISPDNFSEFVLPPNNT